MTKRRILRLSGPDTHDFLQGLITNDIAKLTQGIVYAAMLTPQGKYLADFFLVSSADDVLLDVAESLADMLVQRLSMYKLRAAVEIDTTELHLHRGLGARPADGFADPRCEALGWRSYRAAPQTDDSTDWDALRVAHLVPETGIELTPDTFILEAGFERLNGVDFRKGCYVGQEVTARMKHKTELRKGLAQVDVQGSAPVGTELTSAGKTAGTLFTQARGMGIAYLRFDRATGQMQAGDAVVTRADVP
ncbi:folate-binding protein [Sulfitobacter sp. F26204]|uniref:CAF17-like 4Fe-4S cluster assembly/insertion protein YgfZ n=1 Tax=Sulfitobacter sp. F26204 TaxID=2996014 RepID=UPI00225DE4F0|nr:folate-binding protein [Sulfitobacter sp. F26204]MCX7560721.1 folate-binding protein [Sulfitobacter sp. F26204]